VRDALHEFAQFFYGTEGFPRHTFVAKHLCGLTSFSQGKIVNFSIGTYATFLRRACQKRPDFALKKPNRPPQKQRTRLKQERPCPGFGASAAKLASEVSNVKTPTSRSIFFGAANEKEAIMNIITKYGSKIRSVAFFCFAISALTLFGTSAALAQEPSNKTSAMIVRGDLVFAAPGQPVLIAEELVKTSKPTDLLLSFTAESSIITNVSTVGNDLERATGTLNVEILIDGQPVMAAGPAGPGNQPHGDTASVVFANRTYERQTSLFDDTDATIRTFIDTRHAAGFNWMAFNVGSGVHRIQVFATYNEFESSPQATASGVIGNRSLMVQPVKSAVRETVTLN
jgi:hypothetical protein